MNKVVLMGRLTRDPDVRWSQGQNQTCTARYTLAVDRRIKRENEAAADFISCVSFGKTAEFIENYVKKGTKLVTCGRIQTGSYTNRDGVKVYTTYVIVDEIEFAESKKSGSNQNDSNATGSSQLPADENGFMNIPDGIDEELPFS